MRGRVGRPVPRPPEANKRSLHDVLGVGAARHALPREEDRAAPCADGARRPIRPHRPPCIAPGLRVKALYLPIKTPAGPTFRSTAGYSEEMTSLARWMRSVSVAGTGGPHGRMREGGPAPSSGWPHAPPTDLSATPPGAASFSRAHRPPPDRPTMTSGCVVNQAKARVRRAVPGRYVRQPPRNVLEVCGGIVVVVSTAADNQVGKRKGPRVPASSWIEPGGADLTISGQPIDPLANKVPSARPPRGSVPSAAKPQQPWTPRTARDLAGGTGGVESCKAPRRSGQSAEHDLRSGAGPGRPAWLPGRLTSFCPTAFRHDVGPLGTDGLVR